MGEEDALVYVGVSHLLPRAEREPRSFSLVSLAAGLLVEVDRVKVPWSLDGKGPAYFIRDSGMQMERSDARTVAGLLAGR
jgi:hypothetical protein